MHRLIEGFTFSSSLGVWLNFMFIMRSSTCMLERQETKVSFVVQNQQSLATHNYDKAELHSAPFTHGDVTSLQNEIHMLASSSLWSWSDGLAGSKLIAFNWFHSHMHFGWYHGLSSSPEPLLNWVFWINSSTYFSSLLLVNTFLLGKYTMVVNSGNNYHSKWFVH